MVLPFPIPSKSIPTISCKRRKFPSKKERNRQLFPFKKEIYLFLSNPCGFSYMHNRREYLSGKANGLGLPSREEVISLGLRSSYPAKSSRFQFFQLILRGYASFACPSALLFYIV